MEQHNLTIIEDLKEISANFTKLQALEGKIAAAAAALVQASQTRQKILFCGNGGSAADAQHLAAELTGRYERNRAAYPAIALTVDSSVLTAVANDFGYEQVFARQVEALGNSGDILIAISTSGRSANVIAALKQAKRQGLVTIGLCGSEGRDMTGLCDHLIAVPATRTNRIQEMHIAIGHILCGAVESTLA